MTTIKKNGRQIPFDQALTEARNAYLAGGKKNIRHMTTAELERRKREIHHYLMMEKINRVTSAAYSRREGGRFTAK